MRSKPLAPPIPVSIVRLSRRIPATRPGRLELTASFFKPPQKFAIPNEFAEIIWATEDLRTFLAVRVTSPPLSLKARRVTSWRLGGRVSVVAIALTIAGAAHAEVGHQRIADPAERRVANDKVTRERSLLRELQNFKAVPVSLREALQIVQGSRVGSRVIDVSFDGSADPFLYRVKTSLGDQIWQDTVDAETGALVRAESASNMTELEKPGRQVLVKLRTIRQDLPDAIVVAERNTRGKAVSAGILMDQGRLQFAIVCAVGEDLKQVLLEPPGTTDYSRE